MIHASTHLTNHWHSVWERKGGLAPPDELELAQILRANGYDTGHGDVGVAEWNDYVSGVLARLDARRGDSVYEFGCGAGAFLLACLGDGLTVAGSDYASTLVELARKVLPGGDVECCEARHVPVMPRFDIVVSSGVFLYFPNLEYADAVIRTMVAKARRGVAILDLPDTSHREAALQMRYEMAGGKLVYDERYAGLDQLYYDRDWIAASLARAGATSIEVGDQELAGYPNGAHRFNAWARVS